MIWVIVIWLCSFMSGWCFKRGWVGYRAPIEEPKVARDLTRLVEKPWGSEDRWSITEKYVGKILNIKEGAALSLQYHQVKEESICVLSGELQLVVGEVGNMDKDDNSFENHVLTEGECWHILPGTIHRMIGKTDCRVLEVSTSELEDVVRLRDDYGRG